MRISEFVEPPPPDLEGEWRDEQRLFQDEQRGFWAKLWQFLTDMWESIKNIPAAIGEFFAELGTWLSELGDRIGQFFIDLGNSIMEGLKTLFIPDSDELQAVIDDFKAYAEARLGFVMEIDDLLATVISPITNGGNNGDVILTLPKAQLPGFAGGVTLWQDTGFNLSATVRESSALSALYNVYKALAAVLLLGLLLRYLYKVAEEVLGQRGEGGGES